MNHIYPNGSGLGRIHNARFLRTCLAVSIAAIVLPLAVSAQTSAPDTSEVKADSGQLEAIEVTARYTKEDLQTAPLAITAVTGAQLESRAVTDTSNLGAVVPNLYTRPGDAEEGPTPTISMRRGHGRRLQLRVLSRRRHLRGRCLSQQHGRLDHRSVGRRTRRGQARPAGHPGRQRQHRRVDQYLLEAAEGRRYRLSVGGLRQP